MSVLGGGGEGGDRVGVGVVDGDDVEATHLFNLSPSLVVLLVAERDLLHLVAVWRERMEVGGRRREEGKEGGREGGAHTALLICRPASSRAEEFAK